MGKLSGGNSDGNIAYLKRTNFFVYFFLRAKKKLFFASIYFCKWQVFENFEIINFSPKEKRIRKRQLNQRMFGECFCQDQRKDRQVTMVKLLLLILKQAELTNIFCAYFFFSSIYFQEI